MEWNVGDWIAVGALALSGFTIWRQHGLDKLNRHLNALLIAKEEEDSLLAKRADLSAKFVEKEKHNFEFHISNRGRDSARNVRMEVISGSELFNPAYLDYKFPYPLLDSNQHIGLRASVHMQSPHRATVRLIWDDDAGGGEKEITADVF